MSLPRTWACFVLAIVIGSLVALAWMAQRLIDEAARLFDEMGPD